MTQKIMFYIGEKKEFWGYKPVNFDFKRGLKVRLSDGRFALSYAVFELGEYAFQLVKGEFSEYKKDKRMSIEEKLIRICLFAERYTGEDGNEKARELLSAYEEKFSESLERVCSKILD